MRAIILTVVAGTVLAACTPSNPNDGAQYFDSITPNAATLAAEEQKLARVENGTTPTEAGPSAPIIASNPQGTATISDSQSFARTKERETIESDAAKIAALKSTYQQVSPTAVPTRSGGVNLAAYALKQTNAVGERVYRRFNVGLSNCSRYRNDADAAQRAFLSAGGPEKDSRRLDPDGDGFACTWNPDFYRSLLQNNG